MLVQNKLLLPFTWISEDFKISCYYGDKLWYYLVIVIDIKFFVGLINIYI
jgi:hypothetical protein